MLNILKGVKLAQDDSTGDLYAVDCVDGPKKLTGGGGGSVPKPLTYDYMPEGYPKKSVQTTTLMEEREVTFDALGGGRYGAFLADGFRDIAVGKTYIVTWDGTDYKCVCYDMDGAPTLGNASIADGGSDTGEPFVYFVPQQGDPVAQIMTLDTPASHTISVKTAEETVTPIAAEFLPAPALIVYNSNADTFKSNLTNDELYGRLLYGEQVVLINKLENEQLYLMIWVKQSNGRIDLTFPSSTGQIKVISLFPDGSIGRKPIA